MFEVFGVLSVFSRGLLTWHYKNNKNRKIRNCIKTIEDKKNGVFAWIQVKSDRDLSGNKENSRKRHSNTRSWQNSVFQISPKSSEEAKESTSEHLANTSSERYEYSVSTISSRIRSNYERDGFSNGKYQSSSASARNTLMWSDWDDKKYFACRQNIPWTIKPHADNLGKNEDLWEMTKGKLDQLSSNLNKKEKPRRQAHKKGSIRIKSTQKVPKIVEYKIKNVEEEDEQGEEQENEEEKYEEGESEEGESEEGKGDIYGKVTNARSNVSDRRSVRPPRIGYAQFHV